MNGKFTKDPRGTAGSSELHSKYSINEQIRGEKIAVINHLGENLGLISRGQALSAAEAANLDLVQVGERDGYPVAKIMDFGKFIYAKKKQMSDSKKNQKVITLKEIKLRPNIGDQDYKTKLKKAVDFFAEGKKVKFTLQFKGREIGMMEGLGTKFFQRITGDLAAHDLGALVEEKEQRSGSFWSKIYFIKDK